MDTKRNVTWVAEYSNSVSPLETAYKDMLMMFHMPSDKLSVKVIDTSIGNLGKSIKAMKELKAKLSIEDESE